MVLRVAEWPSLYLARSHLMAENDSVKLDGAIVAIYGLRYGFMYNYFFVPFALHCQVLLLLLAGISQRHCLTY